MQIKSADYLTSVVDKNKILNSTNKEIAIAGRSNVGKSSFINFICGRNKLARTSSEPGRTRMINYFDINKGQFTLVDLPGYGYARVSVSEKEKWGDMIEGYLLNSSALVNVFVLIDIRIDASPLDLQLIAFLYHHSIPFTLIATKMDKVPKTKVLARKQALAAAFGVGVDNILAVSSEKKDGKEAVLQRLDQLILTV